MNNESANAFLKLLEEPPNRTIFLLTATHEKLLPETVISRTRTIQMNLVPLGTLRSYLRKIDRQLSTEKTEELLTLSQGRPARLTRFLEDPDFLLAERSFFHTISKLLTEKSPPEKLRFAEKISSEEDLGEFFDRLLHFLRSLLVEKINAETLPLQAKITLEQIVAMIEKTNNAKTSISKNVNKRLTLESLFLSLV
jgi:DNA polymerase-3 subunit delta'